MILAVIQKELKELIKIVLSKCLLFPSPNLCEQDFCACISKNEK